jgi:tetratricopeptide (TPR) repeat protein
LVRKCILQYVACMVAAATVTGCASRGVHGTAAAPATNAPAAASAPPESLESFVAKVRQLSAEARPRAPQQPQSIESLNPALKEALATAFAAPTPEAYRAVALEYRRLGIFDRAHEYLQKALRLQPRDASTYDALARLWRDSGFPSLALGDAYRSVFFAPESAAGHNTLGTVLQALSRRPLARAQYEVALRLDPTAAYALNNLCYGWVLDGEAPKAVDACQRALAIDPLFKAAHNNLALAHAVAGDMPAAQQAFAANGDRAAQLYNSGIVYLARRQFGSAVKAFEAAHAERPTMRSALARAKQASRGEQLPNGGE